MEAGDFYEKYSTEDFILDERFQDWVMLGRDDKFWGIFCRKHPEKSDMVHSAREFIQTLHLLEHVPGLEQEQKALERFGKQIYGRSGPKLRSEERREGNECVSTCRSWGSVYH